MSLSKLAGISKHSTHCKMLLILRLFGRSALSWPEFVLTGSNKLSPARYYILKIIIIRVLQVAYSCKINSHNGD